jgi:penicillin-binding protein 2
MANAAAQDQQFSRRAFVVGGAMGAVGLTLAARMAYLSIWQGEKYAAAGSSTARANRWR